MELYTITLIVLSIPFLIINMWIIYSDGKNKIIPNRYLWYLLLMLIYWYVYLFYFGFIQLDGSLFSFFLQILLIFWVSFSLYHFWLWSAWDAKYLLVLSLFIPHIWIIPFIWNISLITICYLILYFLYFYTWKAIKQRKKVWWLIEYIKNDNKDRFLNYIQNKKTQKTTKLYILGKISNFIITFFLFFVIIRLLRFALFEWFISVWFADKLYEYIELYSSYIFLWLIVIFIASIYIVRWLYMKISPLISKYLKLELSLLHLIIKSFLFVWLVSYIISEYIANPADISKKLFLIFTLYLAIFMLVKGLWYSYKLAFQIGEQINISPDQLKKWDIVDKQYLLKTYLINKEFAQITEKKDKLSKKTKEFLPNIYTRKYFTSIRNPIWEDEIEKIQSIIYFRNLFYKEQEQQKDFHEVYNIKIMKTFAFSAYIYWGFMVTYAYSDTIFTFLFKNILDIIFHV
jgi:Flp pilus assembly protein protease CpaA